MKAFKFIINAVGNHSDCVKAQGVSGCFLTCQRMIPLWVQTYMRAKLYHHDFAVNDYACAKETNMKDVNS